MTPLIARAICALNPDLFVATLDRYHPDREVFRRNLIRDHHIFDAVGGYTMLGVMGTVDVLMDAVTEMMPKSASATCRDDT